MLVPALFGVLKAIHEQEEDEDEDEDDTQGIVENALFALGALCADTAYRGAMTALPQNADCPMDINGFMAMWLKNLPFKADEIEAKTASRMFCDLMDANDAVLLGNRDNLPEILRVMAEVFKTDSEKTAQEAKAMQTCGILSSMDTVCYAHSATVERMRSLLKRLAASPDGQIAFASISPELQAVLKAQ
jgi:hypothetical protein